MKHQNDNSRAALGAWLRAIDACAAALEWVTEEPEPTVAACERGDWLLWMAPRAGYSAAKLEGAVRPARLRALRIYAATASSAASFASVAARLRGLPYDVNMGSAAVTAAVTAEAAREAAEEAAAEEAASWAAASWAAVAASWAAAAAEAAREAAEEAASWEAASWAASRARAASASRAAAWAAAEREHGLCAADVRAALPDLQQRLDAAVAAYAKRTAQRPHQADLFAAPPAGDL